MAKFQITLEDGSKHLITTEDSKKNGSEKSASLGRFLPRKEDVEQQVSSRRDPVDILREEVFTPFDFKRKPIASVLKPFVTFGKLSAVPVTRASAAVGGLGTGLQDVKGFPQSFEMAKQGLMGEKQFRSFDPLRRAGASDIVAGAGEFITEIGIPMKVFDKVNKIFKGPISKMTDRKLLEAGDDLIKASDDAVTIVGDKLNKVYAPINNVPVNGAGILDDVAKLPDPLIKHIELQVGNLDDYLLDFNIQKARKLKGLIGEFRQSAFGKSERGLSELISDKQINEAYSSVKKSIQTTLKDQGLEKEALNLLEADDVFTETMKASNFIKKSLMDTTLKAPTKIGKTALGIEKASDITTRRALNILRDGSLFTKVKIDKAVESLEKFNRLEKLIKFGESFGKSVAFGSVAGGVAGRFLGGQ